MCGLCGLVSREWSPDEVRSSVVAMSESISHRGPDDWGFWGDGKGLGLGHRRLSILDLSEAGKQPQHSPNDRWTVTYNGEIYNYQDLKGRLVKEGFKFRGHSDTEVLVAALQSWGFEDTIQSLVGMFAIAAWDRDTNKLYLTRDRLGQKPLFYGFHERNFVFGSELSVVRKLPHRPPISPDGAALMLRYKCIPSPYTIYKNFRKLEPASFVVFDRESWNVSQPIRYWSPWQRTPDANVGWEETRERVRQLLNQSVKARMISDVPLGAFLSGGIDSSLVVSLMQANSSRPVKTFTIGYEDKRFNEAVQAGAIARHLGTDQTELYFSESQARELVPRLGELYDEPFSDSSQLPTLLVSQLTRSYVTVALSGDGGDEFFGGYNRHVWLPNLAARIKPIPRPLRRLLAWVLESRWVSNLMVGLSRIPFLPLRLPQEKVWKFARLLKSDTVEDMYRELLSDWREPRNVIPSSQIEHVSELARSPNSHSLLQQLSIADAQLYLPDDILVKVDRASMAYSLEARAPFLDHRLVEYALTIPEAFKVQQGAGKWLLRSLLSDYVPKELFERPKMGFAVPIGGWLRTHLKDWAESLLHSRWVNKDSLLQPKAVQTIWKSHLAGGANTDNQIWSVLMLLSWLESNR